jgi:hypothetical protein
MAVPVQSGARPLGAVSETWSAGYGVRWRRWPLGTAARRKVAPWRRPAGRALEVWALELLELGPGQLGAWDGSQNYGRDYGRSRAGTWRLRAF